MNDMKSIIIVLVGGMLMLLIVGLALPQIASVSVWTTAQSTAMTSVGTAITDYLPIFAMIIMGGMALALISGRR